MINVLPFVPRNLIGIYSSLSTYGEPLLSQVVGCSLMIGNTSIQMSFKVDNMPIQVTNICRMKEKYLSWSATIKIGIINSEKMTYNQEEEETY